MPQVLSKVGKLRAIRAIDGERFEPGVIYVAPPDYHLLVERDRIRVARGPKENRFRPAVDPLFRSAAHAYGNRVVGVVLSGALDDGTSGLWTVKHLGGIAVVQDPRDAEVPSMPESAMREVALDYAVPVSEMARLLVKLTREQVVENSGEVMKESVENKLTEVEVRVAAEHNAFESGIMKFGELTPFTCPDCHGVLSKYRDGSRARFRCYTGHAFSSDALLLSVTENIEESLWNAIRGIEESIMLLNHVGDHFAEVNEGKLAAVYFKKAKESERRAHLVRQVVVRHEQLSKGALAELAAETNSSVETK